MSLKLQTFMQIVEAIAPKRLAEDWDNVGLLVGNPSKDISRVLIALDIDENVVEEAVAKNCQVILTHHPLIFKPLKAIREDLPTGRLIAELIRHDIAVYAAHTNLDSANGGVNDVIASLLDLQKVELLGMEKEDQLMKIVVFIPVDHLEAVRSAMATAGAGHIGNYSHCFFTSSGEGSFKPLEGSNPYIGKQGILEKVGEYRLETIVPATLLKKVVSAMLKAHPYEEVAYDIYNLANEGQKSGIGRIGTLKKTISLENLAQTVKEVFGLTNVKVVGDPQALITKVAVVGGAGASYISLASFRGAQCLVTGDVKYHEAQDALQRGLTIIDAGHYETEYPVLSYLAAKITKSIYEMDKQAEVIVSSSQNTPFVYM